MLRRNLFHFSVIHPFALCPQPGPGKRMGIWPLHLDPPTKEHQNILQFLLEQYDEQNPASRLNLERITVLPSTHFSVSIQYSLHIAAMAKLAMRDLPKVHIDLSSLEKPSNKQPRIQELVEYYGVQNCILLHWLPDIQYLADYSGITKYLEERGDTSNVLKTVLLKPHSGHGERYYSTVHNIALPKSHVVVPVPKIRGAEVRRMLFEGEVDPRTLLSSGVIQYTESHGLFKDFRRHRQKYFLSPPSAPTKTSADLSENKEPSTQPRPEQHVRAAQKHLAHTLDQAGILAFEGLIPRLELHHDQRNVLASSIRKRLSPFEVRPGEHPDLIVPIGGDGYMMHAIRSHWHRFIPFFGVNAGHVGYLLNDAAHLDELLAAPLKLYQSAMLHVTAESYKEDRNERERRELASVNPDAQASEPQTEQKKPRTMAIHEGLAFNDVWVERASGQTALLNVKVNGVQRLRAVRGDAILVATAAGSTAYAQALGASPLPIGAPMLQLVGSNCVSPARWKPVHLTSDTVIQLEALATSKRPCQAFTDGVELGLVKRLTIRSSRVAGVQLAFTESCDIQAKLYKLQFPNA